MLVEQSTIAFPLDVEHEKHIKISTSKYQQKDRVVSSLSGVLHGLVDNSGEEPISSPIITRGDALREERSGCRRSGPEDVGGERHPEPKIF
jgi:hypothetical protein